MATRRIKTRETTTLLTEFPVPITDVVAAFVDAADTQPSDTFSASVSPDGDLVIVRARRTVLLEGPAPARARARLTQ
jgi:hypothetical protein